jgi:tetratricopeptide (TPR) repeat protein
MVSRLLLLGIGVFLLSAIAFWEVGECDFLNYDDDEYVTDNPWVRRGLTGDGLGWAFVRSHSANWHPVTWLSHMTDVELFGLNPAAHHRMNLLLHALASVALLVALWRLSNRLWPSAFVAALFAVHPTHVESVAWISERKDTLSALLAMLTLLAYAEYVRRPGRLRYLVVGGTFALGLMSKPMLVTLPLVLLLLDQWPLRRPDGFRQLTLEKLPLLGLSALSAIATVLAQRRGMALSTSEQLPMADRLLNAVTSTTAYLGKLIWPTDLAVIYPHPSLVPRLAGPSAVHMLGAAFLLLALSALALWARRREWPWVLVGWLWMLGMLVPVIGIVQVGPQAMADRYLYLPSIGFFIMIGWSLAELVRKIPQARLPILALAGAVLILLGASTRAQVRVWTSSETLFRHALAVTEGNWLAHNNLGNALRERGADEEALEHYRAAIALRPDYAAAFYNLGNTFTDLGRLELAEKSFREALRRDRSNPSAWNNLGDLLARLGRFEEAVESFEQALRLNPDLSAARLNAGLAQLRLGNDRQAENHLRLAVQQRPRHLRAREGLARAILVSSPSEALEHALVAAQLCARGDPQALETLARAQGATGAPEDAVRTLREAIQLWHERGEEAQARRLEDLLRRVTAQREQR